MCSFQKSCRPIKCPIWKLLVHGKCEFYSNRWIGGPFAISLRAEAATNEFKISKAFFDEMPQNVRNDNLAKWLKRKTMKRWKLTSFYHLSADNVSVDYLIVQARCPFLSVSPKYIEQTIKRTLGEPWYIYHKNKRIPLKKYMNKGNSYVVGTVRNIEEHNVSLNATEVKEMKTIASVFALMNSDNLMSTELEDALLVKVPEGLWVSLKEEILITNLFFCNQIDLLPEEYEDNGISIFLKVTNTTIYDFHRVNSIAEIPRSFNENGHNIPIPQIIRICLREFGKPTNIGNSKYMFEIKMYFIYSSTSVLIMIVLV